MTDYGIVFLIVWLGSFIVVSVDAAYKKASPVFWRMAALFGGPITLAVYAAKRDK